MGLGRVSCRRLTLSAVALLLAASTASAQYFGRNKVQYDRDRTRVLATTHFDIYYSQEDAEAAMVAGRLAERWHDRLSRALDHTLRGRQPVILYGSHRRFEQTNVYGGLIDESTGGFTDARRRRIVLPFAASLAETDHVLGHEIVHAFQFDIASAAGGTLAAVPLWFVEGMAEYLTLGPHDPQTAMWMRDAVQRDALPAIARLSTPTYFPYRWGAALWAHLVERFGDDLPARALRARRDVKRRLQELTGQSLDELTAGWHESLRAAHRPGPAADVSRTAALLSNRAGGGRLNLGASLSPDGRRLAFLSERDQFSVDLFLADAATGSVTRKLVSAASGTTIESLQYLHSAGGWAPDGARFAIATIKSGRPALLIVAVDGDQATREVVLEELDEAYSPSWSPDGRRIAIAGMRRGVTDIYLVDVVGGALDQLTNDAYADLQPAWSPDGRTIACATDRFTTNLARLTFDGYRIGLVDVTAGRTAPPRIVEAAPRGIGSQLAPAWASDESLLFVGDAGGAANVFRLDRRDGRIRQLTTVETGVSGVTRVSPALSVAPATGTIAFSVFRAGGFEVHTLEAARTAGVEAGQRDVTEAAADALDLAPVPLLPSLPPSERTAAAYRPRLSLEAIGTPYFSAGGGPLGSYVSGGASVLFGDLLGDQQLMLTGYVSSHVDESAASALYINRRARWNWGITLEQVPQLRLRTNSIDVDPDRARTLTRERERTLWTHRRLGGFAAYPLTRGQRLEISAGMRHIGFSRQRRTESVSSVTGMVLDHEVEALDPEPSLGVADAGLALVGDTAMFGATGPLTGTRYRLQTTANVGGLAYTNVLVDYRRYTMPVRPATLAVRLLHAGRYGGDATDPRLVDAFLGSSSLVRGYGAGAVARAECPLGRTDCPALNTLLVNRFVAAKLELRAPLWSLLTRTSRVRYGPLPIDVFAFADAGTGWGGEHRFGPGGSDGMLVRSVGGGARVNVLGLIGEFAAVRPLDLRQAGWSFGFNLRPGF